jgi:hypothetical protein
MFAVLARPPDIFNIVLSSNVNGINNDFLNHMAGS